jgi:hypothetical protein
MNERIKSEIVSLLNEIDEDQPFITIEKKVQTIHRSLFLLGREKQILNQLAADLMDLLRSEKQFREMDRENKNKNDGFFKSFAMLREQIIESL